MSIFKAILFETKFELTIFEIKMHSRKKFRAIHFWHSRTPYMRLMTFTDQFCQIRSNLVKFNPKIVGKGHFVDFF